MTAYERHKQLMLDWQKYYGGRLPQLQQAAAKSDRDSLREAYRFIRSAEDDADDSWEARLARRYYAKLFREYAIADLSRHKVRRLRRGAACSATQSARSRACLEKRLRVLCGIPQFCCACRPLRSARARWRLRAAWARCPPAEAEARKRRRAAWACAGARRRR